MTIKVIHTLTKPYDRMYAGIYIQEPIDGILDRHGRQFRGIHEAVEVREVPNKVIASCLRKTFDMCPSVDSIEYKTPRGAYINISRGQDADSIWRTLTKAGNYVS